MIKTDYINANNLLFVCHTDEGTLHQTIQAQEITYARIVSHHWSYTERREYAEGDHGQKNGGEGRTGEEEDGSVGKII